MRIRTSSTFRSPGVRNPGRDIFAALIILAIIAAPQAAQAKEKKAKMGGAQQPNILVIMGDDIGWFNLSVYNHGMMGYTTPNLDRLAREGGMFTDAYAEQSCTAGRAAFITGQHGLRTGMTKVGLPGVPFGLNHDDPTIAEMLKSLGYTTGQFGKNHLGDTNDTLPTTHGFDEFFGNLYHLNAEQEPEHPDYPDSEEFRRLFGPRGVMHSFARDNKPPLGSSVYEEGKVIETDEYGSIDGQVIVDTGPLTIQRMKTIDGAVTREAIRFMSAAAKEGTPFFTWWAATRMHVWTHLKEPEPDYDYASSEVPEVDRKCYAAGEYTTDELCNLGLAEDYYAEGKTGLGVHVDGMVEHDMYIGALLDFLDESSLDENTIVFYTSDNGAETFTWPDGGTTPFRSEKATNWEGGYRVPLLVRWPGVIKGGWVSNDVISLLDWAPTLVSAASEAAGDRIDIKELLKGDGGYSLNDHHDPYYVHLDGYDFLDYFRCANGFGPQNVACESPRKEFIYANDDGFVTGIRVGTWKAQFYEQRQQGGFNVWQEPFTRLRLAKLFNLRTDPFERADWEASDYDHWRFDRAFVLAPAQVATYTFLQSFQDFPPRQAPPSFSVDEDVRGIIEKCGTPGNPPDEAGNCFDFGQTTAGEFAFPTAGGSS